MHGFYFVQSTYLLMLVYAVHNDLVSKADDKTNVRNKVQY